MANLVYIIGSGRSGSTVIERVLHSAPDVIAVGEVHALWRLPMVDLLCSCGAQVSDCGFWNGALGHAGISAVDIKRLAQLEREVVRNRYLLKLRFDLDRIRRDDRLTEFADLQARLLAGVRAAGQGRMVIDSSKAGPRAWVLAAHLNPVLVHVYRGAEDVIASWRKPKFEPSKGTLMKKPTLQEAAVDWVKVEQAARRLARVRDVRRIDYRAFSTEPKETLTSTLGGRLADAVDWVGDKCVRPAAAYHSVLGNPDRFDQSDIVIAPRRADRADFGRMERRLIRALGRTLERAYP